MKPHTKILWCWGSLILLVPVKLFWTMVEGHQENVLFDLAMLFSALLQVGTMLWYLRQGYLRKILPGEMGGAFGALSISASLLAFLSCIPSPEGKKGFIYLPDRNALYSENDVALRLPWEKTLHYPENPFEGKLEFKTAVLRNDFSELGERGIFVQMEYEIWYKLQTDTPPEKFPEMWEFEEFVVDCITLAQREIPSGQEIEIYGGQEFQKQFPSAFLDRLNHRVGHPFLNHYSPIIVITSTISMPYQDLPEDKGWVKAIFPLGERKDP